MEKPVIIFGAKGIAKSALHAGLVASRLQKKMAAAMLKYKNW